MDPSFSFLYENNIHHFDLILLPGLTLHRETNDVTANLKKKKKNIRVKASGPRVKLSERRGLRNL